MKNVIPGEMMKILFLTLWYPNDENPILGTFVHEQVKAIQKMGIDVRVVQPVPKTPIGIRFLSQRYKNISKIPLEEHYKGVKVYHPRYFTLPKAVLYHHTGMWLYKGILKTILDIHISWPFQLIHSHATFPCGWAANRIRDNNLENVKSLHTIHRASIIDMPLLSQQCKNAVVKSLRESDENIFVSKEGMGLASEYTYGQTDYKNRYITNGVTTEKFKLDPEDEKELEDLNQKYNDYVNILFIGYIIERKGIKELLGAIKQIADSGVGKKIRLFLVGRNLMGNYVKEYIHSNGIAEMVELVGPVLHEKVKIWLRFADIFILPSHSEGLATVLFESLYMEKAAIFTDVGGTRDIVTDQKNALVIKPKSINGISNALLRLIQDEELRHTLGKNGRILIKEDYTWDINAKKNIERYHNLISGKK